MPHTVVPEWHRSLTDSVHALGAAVGELRSAHQHAQLAAYTADPARIVPVVGQIAVPGAEPVRPHDEALWQLSDLYMVLEHHTLELYENAALGYAHGTATALTAVLRNQRPRHVELPRDRADHYALPSAESLPDLGQSLTVAAGARELTALREQLITYEAARTAEQGDSDAEFSAVLANTAHTYGEHAERTLHHLIRLAETHGFLHAS